MSQAPHAAYLRAGQKMGDLQFIDTMLRDGLIDTFHGYHMGNTAENVAKHYQITREQQDVFAAASQNKASAAQKSGRFKDEIAPVTIKGRKATRWCRMTSISVMTQRQRRWPNCARRSRRKGAR